MKCFLLVRRQILPVSMETAWDFFSSPHNLPLITPAWLNLSITRPVPHVIVPGMRIPYRVTPFIGWPVTWISEIGHVDAPSSFVDEQRRGPYRIWRHEHRFRKLDAGIEVTDRVSYALPFGHLGVAVHALLVHQRLEAIFDYRRRALTEILGNRTEAVTGTHP